MIRAALLLLALLAQDGDNVRIVSRGEILKIDAKKKTFDFRINLDAFPLQRGRRGGRGNRGIIVGNPVVEVKVYTSERTILKQDFSTLKVGDRVTVTGIHKGKDYDLEALEIVR